MSAAKPGGDTTPEVYFDAAKDHAAALADLYEHGHFALALYAAGLAVECLFRAFRGKTSGHSLEKLAVEAGFPELINTNAREHWMRHSPS